MGSIDIPQTQTVALVRSLGGEVEFKTDYPVPTPGRNEVLAKVLYTGVCQSGKQRTCPYLTSVKMQALILTSTNHRPSHQGWHSSRSGRKPNYKNQAASRWWTRRDRADRRTGTGYRTHNRSQSRWTGWYPVLESDLSALRVLSCGC